MQQTTNDVANEDSTVTRTITITYTAAEYQAIQANLKQIVTSSQAQLDIVNANVATIQVNMAKIATPESLSKSSQNILN